MLAHMQEDISLAEHFHERITERLHKTREELRRMDEALAEREASASSPLPAMFRSATQAGRSNPRAKVSTNRN